MQQMIFICFNVYITFIIVTFGIGSSYLHHHILDHLLHLLLGHSSFSPSILPQCPAVSRQVFFLVAIITAKISLWSTVKAHLGLGLLWAVSLQVPRLVTGVTIAPGVECVLKIRND